MKESVEMTTKKNGDISKNVHNNPSFEADNTLSPESVRPMTEFIHLTVHQAAREGDVAIMERLLEKYQTNQQRKKKLNTKDDSKFTPLHYASRYSHYHMIQYLIKNGAGVNAKGEDDATALHVIAKYKKKKITSNEYENEGESSEEEEEELPPEERLSCLKLLVDNGAQVNARDAMGLTPLHHACTRGNTNAVRELIQCAGIGMEMPDHQGMTALHLACLYSNKSIVKLLIDSGSNLRSRDKDMTTPLHLACAEGSRKIADLLLEKAESLNKAANATNEDGKDKEAVYATMQSVGGAAELLQDTDGEKNLPLHLAIENGHYEMVEFCVERALAAGIGSMVGICRSRLDSCLHLAVISNSLDIVKFLMSHGADVNARNSNLATPVAVASQYNAHTIVSYLLENGANVDMKDNDFLTPLLIASRYGHLETISHLVSHNADITETDKDDKTCIMWAAEEDRSDALALLIKHSKGRSLIEERDRYNNTALHIASMKGHVATVKLLLEYRAAADIKNDDDRTTLHMAALNGNDLIIPELIARDRTIINSGDEESNSALHLAAMAGNLKCVEILVQLGANIELRNAKQWTPLDCASAFGFDKPAKALLEAGASVQPRGKIKKGLAAQRAGVSPILLAAQFGHVEIIGLLLNWRADVTFRSADGKNALDFAIDHNQKDCVLALIKHSSWKHSLRNSVINPVNGRMSTPMRKLIAKMPDMAELVCNQCITDNGKKPEDDNYRITLLYEFLDDMYVTTTWNDRSVINSEGRRETLFDIGLSTAANTENLMEAVYDENGTLLASAQTYTDDSDELQRNHPLKIMVSSKREELLLHPVVTGLLNYKWTRYGRYVYYFTLLLYSIYLTLLNVYMMTMPTPYEIDWSKQNLNQEYYLTNDSTRKNETAAELGGIPQSQSCYYYRTELVTNDKYPSECQTLPATYVGLKWTIFAFSIFNLLRELFQMINQRLGYILEFTNVVEVTLYVLALLVTIDFSGYYVDPLILRTEGVNTTEFSTVYLDSLQFDTGLRQAWQIEIGAFAVFLSWMGLLLFIQKIPYLGIFVVMFTDILKTFAQFFLVFIFFIMGFAFAFQILLGNQYVFATTYDSLVKTTVMMIGELDFGDIFFGYKDDENNYYTQIFSNTISLVLFSIFLIVMTIIIMNLLVGLAVGDIIEVQEHATLERLGMQVDLALEVEFTIPAMLRKKFCKRKQTVEINKYRKANAVKKFIFEDSSLTVEHITKALNNEEGDSDEMRSQMDRLLAGLGKLRNRIGDVISEQSDVKVGLYGIRGQLREARHENRETSKELRSSVLDTRQALGDKLTETHAELQKVTQDESVDTRTSVEGTRELIRNLTSEVDTTKQMITQVQRELGFQIAEMKREFIISQAEGIQRLEELKREFLERKAGDMGQELEECNAKIDRTRSEVLQSLEEMKMILVKEKYMTSV